VSKRGDNETRRRETDKEWQRGPDSICVFVSIHAATYQLPYLLELVSRCIHASTISVTVQCDWKVSPGSLKRWELDHWTTGHFISRPRGVLSSDLLSGGYFHVGSWIIRTSVLDLWVSICSKPKFCFPSLLRDVLLFLSFKFLSWLVSGLLWLRLLQALSSYSLHLYHIYHACTSALKFSNQVPVWEWKSLQHLKQLWREYRLHFTNYSWKSPGFSLCLCFFCLNSQIVCFWPKVDVPVGGVSQTAGTGFVCLSFSVNVETSVTLSKGLCFLWH